MAKYLINSDFKAIRKGEFISADSESGEFVMDTDVKNCGLSKGQLEEVAQANKMKISSKLNAAEFAGELTSQLENLKIAEVNKMTNSEIVKGIVEKGFVEGKSEEDMLVEIIQSGIKFREAGKLYKQAAEEGGYVANNKKRKEDAAAMMDEAEFAPEHWDEVVSMADQICDAVPGTEQKTAISLIRSWCKANEVTLPKKTKSAKPKIQDGILSFMKARASTVTVDEVAEYIAEQKPEFDEDKVNKMAGRFFKYVEFARGCKFDTEAEQAA